MRPKKVIVELQKNILAYSPFWEEWTQNEACTLSREDLYIIEVHFKNNFTISIFESFMFFNQRTRIESLNSKLKLDQQKFKESFTLEFLLSLIKISRLKTGNYILPLWELGVPNGLIENLLKFNVFTIEGIFLRYNEEDFNKENVFRKVLDRLVTLKELKVLTPKTVCL